MTLTTTSDIVVNVVVVDDHLSPFDRVIAALRARGCRVQVKADGQRARAQCPCPGHADRRESLSVTSRNSVLLLNCFAGCRTNDILAALGLQSRDLFSGPSTLRTRQDDPIAVVYQYVDVRTGVQVEKVRTISKRFFWRHADATARGGYRAGLDGSEPGLYRGEHLIGLKHVLVCEGEKAVNRLTGLGLIATCGPYGASAWPARLTDQLRRCGVVEIVIFPDADVPGQRHARRVAMACWTDCQPLTVKIVSLPGLAAGQDVIDWIDAGHTADELRTLIAATPPWSPEASERARLAHRRALTRARVAKHRAARRVVS